MSPATTSPAQAAIDVECENGEQAGHFPRNGADREVADGESHDERGEKELAQHEHEGSELSA